MNNTLRHALREAAGIAGDATRVVFGSLALPVAVPIALAGTTAISVALLGTFLATETGHVILSELHRRTRLRAPRPPSPSLRGTPTPAELTADALSRPRTLHIRLRIGSRLADLAPTLDTSNHYNTSSTGAKRIAARGRGVKGWIEDNRIAINYSTLMRYKRLAVRLRALLALDERLPLEWLLSGAVPTHLIPPDLLAQYRSAKRKLANLLREHRNFSCLAKHVDSALGIPRLLHTRRTKASPHCIDLDSIRLKNTTRELSRFLQANDLPPKLEKLRRSAIDWFAAEGKT